MPDTHIRIGSVWKSIDNASVKIAAAWKQVNAIYVRIAGAWKFTWPVITLTDNTISAVSGTQARAIMYINTDGTVDERENSVQQQHASATDWVDPNAAASAAYEVKWTVGGASPTDTNMPVADTWYPLTTNRHVGYTRNTTGVEAGTFTVSIRHRTSPVLDTASYSLTANHT